MGGDKRSGEEATSITFQIKKISRQKSRFDIPQLVGSVSFYQTISLVLVVVGLQSTPNIFPLITALYLLHTAFSFPYIINPHL